MENLWGEESAPQPTKHKSPTHTKLTTVQIKATDCLLYGHTWQPLGMSGEKQCLVCQIKGYCPGCTTHPPQNAQPFYCTKHTPAERSV